MAMKKAIFKNRPTPNDEGQFTYGDIGNGDTILGIDTSGPVANSETQLWTKVESHPLQGQTGGQLWHYQGSSIEITQCQINATGIDTDDGGSPNYYRGSKVAFYLFDDDVDNISNNSSGNHIRDLIGQGDEFDYSEHLIGYWNIGKGQENTNLGNVVNTGASAWGSEGLKLTDFPVNTQAKNDYFRGTNIINTNLDDWTNSILGTRDSNFYIVVRTGGDEHEYSPLGHGWWGLSGGYKNDERNRGYAICKIPKSQLKDIWTSANGASLTFTNLTSDKEDSYGDHRGHSPDWMWNQRPRCYDVASITVKVTAPTWSPVYAKTSHNSMWVNPSVEPFTLLNPSQNLDYMGFPSSFYGNTTYFNTNDILDYRPFSDAYSPLPGDDSDQYGHGDTTDVQVYYKRGSDGSVYASAPNDIFIRLYLADNLPNFDPNYWDMSNYDNWPVKYKFFVVNWNWEEGDPDTFEEIADNFPTETSDLISAEIQDGTYGLREITQDSPSHSYSTPGLKIIKVVVFSYVENEWTTQSNSTPYVGYIQSLRWKLLTVRINLSTDKGLQADFGEVGGRKFTFLPYPENIKFTDGSDKLWTSAHPVISGLSPDSTYVTSLDNILKANEFNENEFGEKMEAEAAFDHTPGQYLAEYGNFVGQSDLGQIRFFHKAYDMTTLLGLSYNDIVDGTIAEELADGNWYADFDETLDIENDNWWVDTTSTTISVSDGNLNITNHTGYQNATFGVRATGLNSNMLYRVSWDYGVAPNVPMFLKIGSTTFGADDIANLQGQAGSGISSPVLFETPTTEVYFTFTFNGSTHNDIIQIDEISLKEAVAEAVWHPPYDSDYWDGNYHSFPEESVANSLFINGVKPFDDKCLVELNCDKVDGSSIRDTSGNGCKGILFGDFSITKMGRGNATRRDSFIAKPEINSDKNNGAF